MRDDSRGDTYLNTGIQTTNGWDMTFDLRLSEALWFSGSASIVSGQLKYGPVNNQNIQTGGNYIQLYSNGAFLTKEVETTYLVRRPSNLNVNVFYKPASSILTRIDIKYVGSRYDAYYNSGIGPWGALDVLKIDEYILIDFTLRYEFSKYLSLSLRMENMFDNKYSEILGYTTRGRGIYCSTFLSF